MFYRIRRAAKSYLRARKTLTRYKRSLSDWTRWRTPEDAEAGGWSQRIEDPGNPGTYRIRTQQEFEEERRFMLCQFLPALIRRQKEKVKEAFRK